MPLAHIPEHCMCLVDTPGMLLSIKRRDIPPGSTSQHHKRSEGGRKEINNKEREKGIEEEETYPSLHHQS